MQEQGPNAAAGKEGQREGCEGPASPSLPHAHKGFPGLTASGTLLDCFIPKMLAKSSAKLERQALPRALTCGSP